MSQKARVQKVLEVNFGINNVKHTENGFKAYTRTLTIEMASNVNAIKDLLQEAEFRRSGTQIVFVAELKKEPR
jgi:predicted adenine nucleotide alpha hydrolase (AANH) superfamily ATPase